MPELFTRAFCRKDWKRISAESSLRSPRRPNRSRDWIELNCPKFCLSASFSFTFFSKSFSSLRKPVSKYQKDFRLSYVEFVQWYTFVVHCVLNTQSSNSLLLIMYVDTRLTDVCRVHQSRDLFLPQESNWQKINDLFVCLFFYCTQLRKRGFPWKFAFCLVLFD